MVPDEEGFLGVMEIFQMILAITALSVMAAVFILVRPGFILSSKPVDMPAPGSTREEELQHQIDRIYEEFSADFWTRYHELEAKRDAETLVPAGPEHQELIRMTDEVEEWNVRRVGLLLDLARVRKSPIDEVMREYRHRANAHG